LAIAQARWAGDPDGAP